MKQLLQWITSLFSGPSYQDSLDSFVASKHPQTPADVEYWIREYNTQKGWAL